MRPAAFFGIALIAWGAGCTKPVVVDSTPAPPGKVVLRIWVESPLGPDSHVMAAASLAGKIRACPELEVEEVLGFPERILEFRVDPDRLTRLGVAFSRVVSAVGDAVPLGTKKRMRADSRKFTIELTTFTHHIDEDQLIKVESLLKDIQVKTDSGASLPIAHIASLSLLSGKPQMAHQGQPALYFLVAIKGEQECLAEVLGRFKSTLPNLRVEQMPVSEWPPN